MVPKCNMHFDQVRLSLCGEFGMRLSQLMNGEPLFSNSVFSIS